MKFDKAKLVLRDAALKIGTDLFTREALLKIGQIQADKNVDGAKNDLAMAQFVERLFDGKSVYDKKNADFWEMIGAIAVLDEYEKSEKKSCRQCQPGHGSINNYCSNCGRDLRTSRD